MPLTAFCATRCNCSLSKRIGKSPTTLFSLYVKKHTDDFRFAKMKIKHTHPTEKVFKNKKNLCMI